MSRTALRPALRMAARGARRVVIPALTLTATTSGAGQTVTIHRMTPAAGTTLTIDWGDGNSTTVSAGDTASKAHVYASAGSYPIRVTNARDIVQIDLHDNKLSGLKSAELEGAAITSFVVYSLGAAETNVVSSADMASWTPTQWTLYYMPAGGTYTIDSAHMASWTPTFWQLYNMPAGTYTFAAANLTGWTIATMVRADGLGLLQAAVDAILWGLYQATLSRTVTGGTINVGGTNAAPSGTYQAATTCPVTAATPGKEVAHELLNDGCNAIAAGETWTTVTITA